MTKQPPKKRKEDSVNEAPSQPDGVRRPSEGGGSSNSNNPPTSTSI